MFEERRQDKGTSNKPDGVLKNLIHYSGLLSTPLDKCDHNEGSSLSLLISRMVICMPKKQNDPLQLEKNIS